MSTSGSIRRLLWYYTIIKWRTITYKHIYKNMIISFNLFFNFDPNGFVFYTFLRFITLQEYSTIDLNVIPFLRCFKSFRLCFAKMKVFWLNIKIYKILSSDITTTCLLNNDFSISNAFSGEVDVDGENDVPENEQ